VEKEFAQAAGSPLTGGAADINLLREVLQDPENSYLGRHLCWIFSAQHIEAFVLAPRGDADIARLMEAVPSADAESVLNVVVGQSSEVKSRCTVPGLPTITFEQLLTFTSSDFSQALLDADREMASAADSESAPEATDASSRDEDRAVIRDLFDRLTRRSDNRGISDEHRALNYVALRYPRFYSAILAGRREGKALASVEALPAASTDRRMVAVRATLRNRRTDIIERYRCLVDVTEVFPFLVTSLELTYD